jgi:cell division protein FtsB
VTNPQRRTARGAATRTAPGPRRRTAQPHELVSGRARAGRPQTTRPTPRREEVDGPRPILKTLTKLAARAVLGVVILAVFVFGVFPTGSYVEQRTELRDAEGELADLEAQNATLEARVQRLESDEEIEREAREKFKMVFPNEESYLILPPGE